MGPIIISVSGWVFGAPPKQQSLCGDCTADLALSKDPRTQLHKMSFRGPVLLRQEEGYFVAVLPFHLLVSFRPIETFDAKEMIDNARRLISEAQAESQRTRKNVTIPLVHCRDDFPSPAARRIPYERLAKDPNPDIARWAKHELKQLRQKP